MSLKYLVLILIRLISHPNRIKEMINDEMNAILKATATLSILWAKIGEEMKRVIIKRIFFSSRLFGHITDMLQIFRQKHIHTNLYFFYFSGNLAAILEQVF